MMIISGVIFVAMAFFSAYCCDNNGCAIPIKK
jgi:hypothetical protein